MALQTLVGLLRLIRDWPAARAWTRELSAARSLAVRALWHLSTSDFKMLELLVTKMVCCRRL
jgi:hypothetical protein